MNVLQKAALWFAKRTGIVRTQTRQYKAARPSRDSNFSTATTSGDSEVRTSLTNLRGHSRALARDSAYGKRAKAIIVNNVIGVGMGLQGDIKTVRGTKANSPNTQLEKAFKEWCKPGNCHTGGELHFHDLERQIMGQVFETGEVFIRLHRRQFGSSEVPFDARADRIRARAA